MELSKRMEAVAAMVSKGNRIADIGTDHGYVPIALVKRGRIPNAIAMDVKVGPLTKAKNHIAESKLDKVIITRLSNGLENLKQGEVDTIIIAGMGGALICNILEEGRFVLTSIKELVLQPQSEIYKVRWQLHKLGWKIVEEEMLIEESKYYTVIKAQKGMERYARECDYLYGQVLLKKKHLVLFTWLQKESKTCEELLQKLKMVKSQSALDRKEELLHRQILLKEALAEYESM